MSPIAGDEGGVVLLGTFNEAYAATDGANTCDPPVKILPPARFALSASAAVARVVSPVMLPCSVVSAAARALASSASAVARTVASLATAVLV